MSRHANALISIVTLTLSTACARVRIAEDAFFNPVSTREPVPAPFSKQDVWFAGDDGTSLHAWWLTQRGARGTLVNFGGNTDYVFAARDFLASIAGFQLNVLLVDYRGYGESEGTLDPDNLLSDGMAAYRYVAGRADVEASRIVVRGMSLGSFPALRVSAEAPVAATILEGAGTNVRDFTRGQLSWLLRPFVRFDIAPRLRAFDNTAAASRVRTPLLVLVGSRDSTTPPSMARKLYRASPSALKRLHVLEGGRHGELHRSRQYCDLVQSFLTAAVFKDQAVP